MKKIVTLGEVMMRLSPPGHSRFFQAGTLEVEYGGSEANVGSGLAFLGNHAIHLTSFPDSEIGEAALGQLKKNGMDVRFAQRYPGRIGIYFLEHGAMQRSSKIIYDRSESVFAKHACQDVDWDQVLEGVDLLHWSGITPALSQCAADFTLEAISQAKHRKIAISADPSFRSNLWKYGKRADEIMPELLKHSTLIIGGIHDFKVCLDLMGSNLDDLTELVFDLFEGLDYIATTHRHSHSSSANDFSATLYSRNTKYDSKKYELTHIVDRVGTGDAFAAGLIHGLLHDYGDRALELGVAAAVFKHSVPGDLLYASLAELNEIIDGDALGKIKR
ncbi:sugar kinase [Algoriphagus namhaensis]